MDGDFLAYCKKAKGRPDPGILRDPSNGLLCDIQHLGATLGAVFKHTLDSDASKDSMVDFGGWMGDLITAAAEAYNAGIADSEGYDYAYGMIGNNAGQGTFASGDLLADVDAMVVGLAVQADGWRTISGELASRYANAITARARFSEFITRRFGNRSTMTTAAENTFAQNSDAEVDAFRGALWLDKTSVPIGISTSNHPTLFQGVCDAFVDVVVDRFA